MRNRKIRGHNRRQKQIESWRQENLEINIDLLEKYNREFVKIFVHPWCDISIINSAFPNPTGKTKKLILKGLLDIYENRKKELDKLGQPFYLKIWLFEPRFSNSQVVCAIKDRIDFYENNFFKPNQEKLFKPENYGTLKPILERFEWDYRLDEDHYDNSTVGASEEYASSEDFIETQKWFEKLIKKPHRIEKLKEPIGDIIESYSFNRGDLWLGGQK